jgi:parallel beta-helix repeat protein
MSDYNTITGNNASNNMDAGIGLQYSNDNHIYLNIIIIPYHNPAQSSQMQMEKVTGYQH